MKNLTLMVLVLLSMARAQTQIAPAAATRNAAVVKSGLQTTYTLDQLLGTKAARFVASNQYQIAITFPKTVQSIGVNAAKQSTVLTTLDKSDGRVLYIDLLRADTGTANLNVRLAAPDGETQAEPEIVKLLLELTTKPDGVLFYSIRNAAQGVTVKVAQAPSKQIVVTAPLKAAPLKPLVIKPASVKPGPAKPAAVPVVKAAPVVARPATPLPAPRKRSTPAPPVPSLEVRAGAPQRPRLPSISPRLFTGQRHDLAVTVKLEPDPDAPDKLLASYQITTDEPKANVIYEYKASNVNLWLRGEVANQAMTRAASPNANLLAGKTVSGRVQIERSVFGDRRLSKTLMFTLNERSTTTGLASPVYLGVVLKWD